MRASASANIGMMTGIIGMMTGIIGMMTGTMRASSRNGARPRKRHRQPRRPENMARF